MKKFEYKELRDCGIDKMNELGLDGWELITIIIIGSTVNSSYSYFKREKIERRFDPQRPQPSDDTVGITAKEYLLKFMNSF